MRNWKYFFTCFAMLSLSLNANAQDEIDALRYSFLMPQATARSMGFGSALGSIGGDFASLSVNPAGIGIYRKSEFMFTPSLKVNGVDGNYLGLTNSDNNARFNFNNIGLVFTKSEKGRRYERSKWKAISFAIGFNRVADFNRDYTYGGLMKGTGANASSFSEIFVADAQQNPNNLNVSGTLAEMGYDSYLINKDAQGYYTLANYTTGLNQTKSVKERGGINELIFSLGGNYEEKLMLGATLGLPTIRYTREDFFQETDATNDPNNYFASFIYNEKLKTSGLGVNLKLGAIYKPTDYLRFGIALHTPTWYNLSDIYNNSLTANTETFKSSLTPQPSDTNPITTIDAPENRFDYALTTPWRAIVSATGILGKYGFITADYEYVDYHSIRYSFDNQYAVEESLRNNVIKSTYKAASNFRIGAEARVLDNFSVRAGFGYYGSPYKNSSSNTNLINLSLGLGYRFGNFFTDLAFVHSVYDQYESPYALPYTNVVVPTATLNNKLNNVAMTIGWKL